MEAAGSGTAPRSPRRLSRFTLYSQVFLESLTMRIYSCNTYIIFFFFLSTDREKQKPLVSVLPLPKSWSLSSLLPPPLWPGPLIPAALWGLGCLVTSQFSAPRSPLK